MYSVYQHWDKLKVCVVGKTYEPEFYSFIENKKLRNLFEKIAIETQEDLDFLANTIKKFDVEIVRPNIPHVDALDLIKVGEKIPGPVSMIPRDQMIMIGDKFFLFPYKRISWKSSGREKSYNASFTETTKNFTDWWTPIFEKVSAAGNEIVTDTFDELLSYIPTNGITRCGKDLYIGMNDNKMLKLGLKNLAKKYFKNYRCHSVMTYGHLDGSFMPVIPGLIVSIEDIKTYEKTFPDWEVLYLPQDGYYAVKDFFKLKEKNGGKWLIKGYENDDEVIEFVETWLQDWVGYVEETVFDVNMLVIDQKNVIVSSYNKKVFEKFEQYGITGHICPLRHRYFWDGGIHCSTLDLDREGTMQNYFPERGEP
jgi:hypothetical protein